MVPSCARSRISSSPPATRNKCSDAPTALRHFTSPLVPNLAAAAIMAARVDADTLERLEDEDAEHERPGVTLEQIQAGRQSWGRPGGDSGAHHQRGAQPLWPRPKTISLPPPTHTHSQTSTRPSACRTRRRRRARWLRWGSAPAAANAALAQQAKLPRRRRRRQAIDSEFVSSVFPSLPLIQIHMPAAVRVTDNAAPPSAPRAAALLLLRRRVRRREPAARELDRPLQHRRRLPHAGRRRVERRPDGALVDAALWLPEALAQLLPLRGKGGVRCVHGVACRERNKGAVRKEHASAGASYYGTHTMRHTQDTALPRALTTKYVTSSARCGVKSRATM